jgi:hypothetical protein
LEKRRGGGGKNPVRGISSLISLSLSWGNEEEEEED